MASGARRGRRGGGGVRKVVLRDAFGSIDEIWSPHVAGRVNDCLVKLARLRGEFVWHSHADEDEMFLVVKGRLTMRLRGRSIELRRGEFLVVPRGVEHKPVAEREVQVLLFEPATTRNTGDAGGPRTMTRLRHVR